MKRFSLRSRATGPHARTRVIFDAESLLIDPTPGIQHCLRLTAGDFGVAISERWLRGCWSLRMSFPDAMRHIFDTDDLARIEDGCLCYHGHYSREGRFRGHLRPGALRLFADLTARSDLELTYLTHIGAAAAARLLDTYGLQRFVRCVVTPEEAHCPGVRLPLIEHLVTLDETSIDDWVLISDHPLELHFARRLCPLRTIGIGYARLPLEMLRALQPDAVAAHPGEVAALLLPERFGASVHEQVLTTIH
jgi:phosphoglycolate phosphatase-like HAD superfamily hydrolase